jgi:hypothetical protein
VNEVFSATKGVIFLGTPHRGASGQYAEVGEQLRRLVGIFLHGSNSHLLSSLKSDSETLPRISEDFHRLCDENPFLVFSFVETLPITNIKGIGLVRSCLPLQFNSALELINFVSRQSMKILGTWD